MTTISEPSVWVDDDGERRPVAVIISAKDLHRGHYVTNLGIVDAVTHIGVFVVASIRGTVWNLGTGKGDIATLDVTWHVSQHLTVDAV